MTDSFGNPPQDSFPAPGQTPFVPPPPASPPYGAPTEPLYTPGSSSGFGPPGLHSSDSAIPMVGDNPPSKRSRGKMIGAVVGVVAVLAAGTFAFTQLKSNDSEGGAGSPKEVGDQLISALDNEDILGAIDLLLPGERETFRQPMIDLVDEMKRLQVADDSADLSDVGGFDISITDAEVDVEETNVADVSLVSIAATSSVSVNGDDLPIGDFLIERAFGGDRPEVNEDSGDEDFNLSFASVEKGGRWYVSLFYSAANAAFGGQDIPEEGIKAVGASSPEGAMENLVQYMSNLDLENVIASLNPNEAEALQRYAPLFLGDAQDALDDVEINWKISDVEYNVTGGGDTRQVGVSAFNVEAAVAGETVEFSFADGCLVGTSAGEDFDSCTLFDGESSSVDDSLDSLGFGGNEAVQQLIEDARGTFSDFSMHGMVVDKVDGEWYVSPLGTNFELYLSVMRAVDRDEIETLIEDFRALFDKGMSMPDFDFAEADDDYTDDTYTDDTYPDDTYTDDTYTDDTYTDDTYTDDTYTDDTYTDDTTSDGTEEEFTSYFDCYQFNDVKEFVECVEAGVADGSYDTTFIPAPFLFPECGLVDYYYGLQITDDDAATFLATIEPGRQCIVDAAAAAGLDIATSSPELVYPECFAQDNPYNFGEENEVSGYDCVFQTD